MPKPTDAERIAEAAAKMRWPEIRLNPVDYGRLFNTLAPTQVETAEQRQRADCLADLAAQAPLASIPVIADASVQVGHLWLRDADPEPLGFTVPASFDEAIERTLDRLLSLKESPCHRS